MDEMRDAYLMKLFSNQIEYSDRTEDFSGGKGFLFDDCIEKECDTCGRGRAFRTTYHYA